MTVTLDTFYSVLYDLSMRHAHDTGRTPTHMLVGPDAQEIIWEFVQTQKRQGFAVQDPRVTGKPAMFQGMEVVKTQENGLSVATLTKLS